MRIRKFAKGSIAAALICMLSLSGAGLMQSEAAAAIDTGQECSITIEMEGLSTESDVLTTMQDLKELKEIPVKIYQVADISATGKYTAQEGYKTLQNFLVNVSDSTNTEDWENCAKEAAAIVENNGIEATGTIQVSEGTGKLEGLTVGLYLVMADTIYDNGYLHEYSFLPYLISLPNNHYAENGNDEWTYDVVVSLKPQMTELKGDLVIHKTVTAMNSADGAEGVTSVFRITAVNEGETIYSNVVSIRHKEAKEQSVTIGKFPAGTAVTVEEIYAGAGYKLDTSQGGKTQTAIIISDKAISEGASRDDVFFTNVPDDTLTGGYGVTNHFVKGEEDPENIQKISNVEVTNSVLDRTPEDEEPKEAVSNEME